MAITTASCSFKGGVDPLMIKAMSVIGRAPRGRESLVEEESTQKVVD